MACRLLRNKKRSVVTVLCYNANDRGIDLERSIYAEKQQEVQRKQPGVVLFDKQEKFQEKSEKAQKQRSKKRSERRNNKIDGGE